MSIVLSRSFMESSSLLLLSSALLVITISYWSFSKLWKFGRREDFLPPGPPTIPILGNIHLLPKEYFRLQYTDWARAYGPIYSLKLASSTMVVLSGRKEIQHIIEKNSASTSDRPSLHLADRVTGYNRHIVFAHYSDTWRAQRRSAHEILTPQSCRQHLPIQKAEAVQLSFELLTDPKSFANHIHRYTLSVILSVLFGKRVPRNLAPEMQLCSEMIEHWLQVLAFGAHPPVDLIPILQKVPKRFAFWKRLCDTTKDLQTKLYFTLLEEVEFRLSQGTENNCFMETILQRGAEWGLDRDLVGYLGGALVEAGTETTATYLESLVLMLVAHPEVQKKAQAEIDSVIGPDTMPVVDDIARLPYVQAVIYETQRYRPVIPLSVPHAATEDVIYNKYIIPKGAIICHNIWGLFHDPEVFDEPEKFNPDRFLGNPDIAKIVDTQTFGGGRRSCPGAHLARNSLILNTMNLLWGFNFGKACDENGHEIEVDVSNYKEDITCAPNPFTCSITARGTQQEATIRREFQAAETNFSYFEHGISVDDTEYLHKLREEL